MHEQYSEALAALVEGRLDPETQAWLETHLEACAGCRAAAVDLRRIRRTAAQLERYAPPAGAWNTIAARLEGRHRRSSGIRFDGTWWRLAAAAVVLVAAASAWILRDRPPASPATGTGIIVESIEVELRLAEEHFEKAISGLEQIATLDDEVLDPEVVSALRQSLTVIDDAIEESRAALRAQPQSATARETLFEALRRKVGLLQDTIILVNEMRKGNEAEAARIAEGLSKS